MKRGAEECGRLSLRGVFLFGGVGGLQTIVFCFVYLVEGFAAFRKCLMLI